MVWHALFNVMSISCVVFLSTSLSLKGSLFIFKELNQLLKLETNPSVFTVLFQASGRTASSSRLFV